MMIIFNEIVSFSFKKIFFSFKQMITVSHEETKAGKYTLKINTVNNSLAISLEYHVLNHNKYSIELNEFTYPQLSELIKFSFGDKQ